MAGLYLLADQFETSERYAIHVIAGLQAGHKVDRILPYSFAERAKATVEEAQELVVYLDTVDHMLEAGFPFGRKHFSGAGEDWSAFIDIYDRYQMEKLAQERETRPGNDYPSFQP